MRFRPIREISPVPRGTPQRRAIRAVAALAVVFAGHASADAYLDSIGGSGGGQFKAHCVADQVVVGFELRAGDDVDAIRPLCVIAYAPKHVADASFTTGTGLIQKFSSAQREVYNMYSEAAGDWSELVEGWYGGVGGGITNVVCPRNQPVVSGMFVGAEGVDTVIVNNIHLFCGLADGSSAPSDYPAAVFDAPAYRASKAVLGIGGGGDEPYRDGNTQRCPGGQVAVGLHGRSGKWLDAIGLICGVPRMDASVKSLGRVNPGAPPPHHPAGWTICDSARDARARNSPAAPNLEAQCAAHKPPAKTLGRVPSKTSAPSGPPMSICDHARDARARNSPAAPNLEAQCHAAGDS